jgi:ferritin
MNKKINDAIGGQINKELFSAYLYLAMSGFLESQGLKGAANWMKVQAQEELFHANKFFTYIYERGGMINFPPIGEVKIAWTNIMEIYQAGLKHEQFITASINDLMSLAIAEKDFATQNFLQWFIAEQVEEEKNAEEIIQKLNLIGNDKSTLFMLDTELGTRVFIPPTTNTNAA